MNGGLSSAGQARAFYPRSRDFNSTVALRTRTRGMSLCCHDKLAGQRAVSATRSSTHSKLQLIFDDGRDPARSIPDGFSNTRSTNTYGHFRPPLLASTHCRRRRNARLGGMDGEEAERGGRFIRLERWSSRTWLPATINNASQSERIFMDMARIVNWDGNGRMWAEMKNARPYFRSLI